MSEPTARAVPFYCPYCGEDRIRPWDDEPEAPAGPRGHRGGGQWRCEDCSRVFAVRYTGMTGRP